MFSGNLSYTKAMISYLSGIIKAIGQKYIILDVNGVGYRVTIPERIHSTLAKMGEKVNMYIYSLLNAREGIFVLYGFESPEELNFFELLLTVSGVGPKYAQGILSSVDLQTLQLAIIKGDDVYLKKVSGIGTKTAQRIILELKTKILTADLGTAAGDRDFTSEGEAIDALVTLGYSAFNAREALKSVSEKAKTTEDKIKEALKMLGNKK